MLLWGAAISPQLRCNLIHGHEPLGRGLTNCTHLENMPLGTWVVSPSPLHCILQKSWELKDYI